MSRDEIVKKVIQIASERSNNLEKSANELNEDSSFVEDFGTDSLDLVEIVMGLEEEFDISISEEASADIKLVRDAVDYIEKNIK